MLSETGSLQDISGLTDVDTIDQIAWSSDNQLAIEWFDAQDNWYVSVWDGSGSAQEIASIAAGDIDLATLIPVTWSSDNQLAIGVKDETDRKVLVRSFTTYHIFAQYGKDSVQVRFLDGGTHFLQAGDAVEYKKTLSTSYQIFEK